MDVKAAGVPRENNPRVFFTSRKNAFSTGFFRIDLEHFLFGLLSRRCNCFHLRERVQSARKKIPESKTTETRHSTAALSTCPASATRFRSLFLSNSRSRRSAGRTFFRFFSDLLKKSGSLSVLQKWMRAVSLVQRQP
jgi:hypothetical protein